VDEYHRLIDVEFFRPDERIELIDGILFVKNPMSPRHRACMHRLVKLLEDEFEEQGLALVLMQSPITLAQSNSEPEPDVVVVQYRDDDYVSHHPGPDDIYLSIEVSRTTLKFDQDAKYQLYAREGIAEYWVLNLIDDLLEVYQSSYVDSTGQAGYRTKQTFERDKYVSLLKFPSCRILVDDIFPERRKKKRLTV